MDYLERLKAEADTFAQQLTQDYPLVDVTTKMQKKNGTRMFKLGDSLFATYQSGMVRKIIRTRFNELSCYQLNPTRIGKEYFMNSDLTVTSYPSKSRVKIYTDERRLMYLKKYLIKNYNMLPLQDIIEVDGVKYKRI
tara:strand:+ start:215 stop:625 length:411 start_codon:yes stop_codon:yes gene_type:complete